jgi:hypothetical protein
MLSPIYQNVIDKVVCLSIRRGPGVFMDAAMGEHASEMSVNFNVATRRHTPEDSKTSYSPL